MGRTTKALEKLREKCTEEGHAPAGNSIADILDCIAEHFSGGGGAFVFRLDTDGDGTATSDVPIADVYAAALSGVPVIAKVFMGDTIQFVCSLTQADKGMLMYFGTYEDEENEYNHFPAVSTWSPQGTVAWRINKPIVPLV